jgi:hypothetical protein
MSISLQNFNNRPFSTTFFIDSGNACQRSIIVQQGVHFSRRQKQVIRPVIRLNKTETVRMANNAPGN